MCVWMQEMQLCIRGMLMRVALDQQNKATPFPPFLPLIRALHCTLRGSERERERRTAVALIRLLFSLSFLDSHHHAARAHHLSLFSLSLSLFSLALVFIIVLPSSAERDGDERVSERENSGCDWCASLPLSLEARVHPRFCLCLCECV